MKHKIAGFFLTKPARFLIGAISGLAAFSFGNASPTFNSPADIKTITDLETYVQLQVDLNNIVPDYAPDAIIYDKPAPGVYFGIKQIYDGYASQMKGIAANKVRFPDLNIVSDGSMACAAMQLDFDVAMQDGTKINIQYRDIDVLRKTGGKWLIIQSHLSFPADAKTGMSVMKGPIEPVGRLNWGADTIQAPGIDPAQAKTELVNWMIADAHTSSSEQLGQFYGPDDNTIIYDAYNPGDIRGIRQIEDYYRPFFAEYTSIKPDIKQYHVDTDGLIGAVMSQQDMALTAKDGSRSILSFRQNDCLHRVNGKWYSFFEMVSFPTDFKTGKAVTVSPTATLH